MQYTPTLHRVRNDGQKNHRRSVRLRYYDYRQPGAYFVTICVDKRICLFGEIVNGVMQINNLGKTVQAEWLRTPAIRPQVILDEYVVMPNHFPCDSYNGRFP